MAAAIFAEVDRFRAGVAREVRESSLLALPAVVVWRAASHSPQPMCRRHGTAVPS